MLFFWEKGFWGWRLQLYYDKRHPYSNPKLRWFWTEYPVWLSLARGSVAKEPDQEHLGSTKEPKTPMGLYL
jgi:hypothetical protein